MLKALDGLDAAVVAGDVERISRERDCVREALLVWFRSNPSRERRALVERDVARIASSARKVIHQRGREPDGGLIGDVLIVGRTGAGKSTLVNAIVGRAAAATGVGRPVTQKVRRHKVPDSPAALIDTPGVEVGGRQAEPLPVLARLADVVWFCVPAEEGRLELEELRLLSTLRNRGPVLLVATRILDRQADLGWLKELAKGSPVITLARERRVGTTAIPPHGLETLVRATRDAVTSAPRSAATRRNGPAAGTVTGESD